MQFIKDTREGNSRRILGPSIKKATRARDEEILEGISWARIEVAGMDIFGDLHTHPLLDTSVGQFLCHGGKSMLECERVRKSTIVLS